MQPVRPRLPLVLVAALTGAALAVLVGTHPAPAASSWADGDDLAVATSWAVALVTSAWLFAGSVACLAALGLRRPHVARSLACVLPSAVRRAVDVAIVASCLAVSAAPAHAANTGPGLVVDQPVVRAPRPLAVPPVHVPRAAPRSDARRPPPRADLRGRALPAPTTATLAPQYAPPTAPDTPSTPAESERHTPSVPTSAVAPTTPRTTALFVAVRPGDNLWVIARAELIRTSRAHPRDDAIARYWRLVIDANRATLRSGNPSVIFPGELVTLPPVPGVS
jgi:hypothetical protein